MYKMVIIFYCEVFLFVLFWFCVLLFLELTAQGIKRKAVSLKSILGVHVLLGF